MKLKIRRPGQHQKLDRTSNNVIVRFRKDSLARIHDYNYEVINQEYIELIKSRNKKT